MRIAAMQDAATVGDSDANLTVIDQRAAGAAAQGADVLVTPELFVSGYAPNRLHGVDPNAQIHIAQSLETIARRHRIAVLASYPEVASDAGDPGLVESDGAADQAQQFIAATLFTADGEQVLHYRKVNLFDDDEAAAFTPGTAAPTVVELAGLSVAVVVCFDVEYPEMVRAAALAGAEVVLVPTALTTGFDDVADVLVRARALENGVALAYVNHVGDGDGLTFGGGSVIVGPDGGVLAQAGDAPELLVADVDPAVITAARERVSYLAKLKSDTYAAWR